tara:strand:+ start:126 stop:575 length:450 start_codon:yes stop_codon:yes gene_type:complete
MATPFQIAWTFLKADLSNIVSERPQGDEEGMGAWQTMHPAVRQHGGDAQLAGIENNNYYDYAPAEPEMGRNSQHFSQPTKPNYQIEGRPSRGEVGDPQRGLDLLQDGSQPLERPANEQQAISDFQNFQQQQKPIEQGLPQMNPNVMQQM